MPSWLIGLILAAVVFALTLFVLDLLGYGDDPAVGAAVLAIQRGGGIGLPLQSTPSAGR